MVGNTAMQPAGKVRPSVLDFTPGIQLAILGGIVGIFLADRWGAIIGMIVGFSVGHFFSTLRRSVK
jgi:hypothetical protein